MLYLIGLGLNDEKDITLKAVEIARKCDCYCELYTSVWKGSMEGLRSIIGKEVKLLRRKDMEEGQEALLDKAKKIDIAIFMPGDPLAATTHFDIVYEAKRRKIPVRTIHNASIFSAIGETGLQLYKFGKTATVPMSGRIENVKSTLKENKKLGLHTLLLLDIDIENSINMTVKDAVKMLLKEKLVKDFDDIVAFSKAGGESEIKYKGAKEFLAIDMGLPAVIIVPGKLHFRERDFLELF
jgi:diphthine synthase